MSTHLEIISRSPQETQRIGAALGECAQMGDVVLLVGDLGAGKTCLVQGMASGLGVKEHTRSPTFVFLCLYEGRLPLYHADLYRVERPEELGDLGLEEYLYGDGVTVIEWADRALPALPAERLLVRIEHMPGDARRLTFETTGSRYQQLLDQVKAALAAATG